MLLEGESINLHGTPLNRLSPANQSRSRHGPSHLSVQGTRRRLLSAWAGATSSVPGNSSCRRRCGGGGGRTEKRKIMYNTNKVSPPAFIPNQFLVEEPNPEGRWEGGDAPGRNLVTRCTPVNRDKSCYMHSSPLQSHAHCPAAGSCTSRTRSLCSRAEEDAGGDSRAENTVEHREIHQLALRKGASLLHANSIHFLLYSPITIWGGILKVK